MTVEVVVVVEVEVAEVVAVEEIEMIWTVWGQEGLVIKTKPHLSFLLTRQDLSLEEVGGIDCSISKSFWKVLLHTIRALCYSPT